MNSKIIAIIIAAVIVVAGVGVFLTMNHGAADKEINVIARVNTEGSGIYLDEGQNPSDYLTVMTPAEYAVYKVTMPETDKALENDRYAVVFHTGAWDTKIFGTPGTTTIQHMQFKEIVEDVMGMNFTLFRDGQPLVPGNVYYDAGVYNYSVFSTSKADLTGAFIWQAQYSIALANGCVGLVMTDVLFPEHTCCVLAGTHSYMSAHDDATKAFLQAYTDSVNAVNRILTVGSGDEYDELVTLTVNKLGLKGDNARQIVEEALGTINYTYYDGDAKDPLKDLKSAIADLAEKYEVPDSGSGVRVTLKELGFNNGAEFAEKFVDDDYLSDILEKDLTPLASKVSVKVAVISGDIHQIAIHYGIDKGIFSGYNVDVVLSSQSNGPGVATALENGEANFGLVGAPPLTIKVMNGKLVTD